MSDSPSTQFLELYPDAFTRRCHELLRIGHSRLNAGALATLDETAITGKLCDEMEAALDAPDRPEWGIHLTVVDDQPESVDQKTGKRRPRTDICVRSTANRIRRLPATRFRFEAKRLGKMDDTAHYLGEKGMLALITGYYGENPFSGMVGYVQSDTCSIWEDRLKDAMRSKRTKYKLNTPVNFEPVAPKMTSSPFLSNHTHNGTKKISHTLLQCA